LYGASQPGGAVRMVNGLYRGNKGVLQEINTDKFQALVGVVVVPLVLLD
jgi:hypothetical protein